MELGFRRTHGAALIVAAGCLVTVSSGCAGQQYASLQGYNETAIVSADGRTITVGPYPRKDCPATITVVATESETQVALFLDHVTPPKPPPCTPEPNAAMASVFAHNIRLRNPLGNRELVDGVTGQTIAWISARIVLRVTDASYRLLSIVPMGSMSGTQGVAAGAIQYYTRLADPNGLSIVQSAGSVPVPGPAPGGWMPIRVRGHQGRATRNLISWRENGLTDYIAVSYAVETENMDYPQVLSTRELIAVADSVQRLWNGQRIRARTIYLHY